MDKPPIMQQIANCYHSLKPENLIESDKMLASDIIARQRQINSCLQNLFKYTGRVISTDEVFEWERNHGISPPPQEH